MNDVDRNGDEFIVDAQLLAAAFGLSAEEIGTRMRDGRITSRCETGQGEDEGRWRLTFRHHDRALRLVVDEQGRITAKSTFPVSPRGTDERQSSQALTGADRDG